MAEREKHIKHFDELHFLYEIQREKQEKE